MLFERTIRKSVRIDGVGLHSGEAASLVFTPAPPGTGIIFVRKDLPGNPTLPVQSEYVTATTMATTIGNQHFSVATVEHCLASLAALRIDNLIIELSGPEIPICDGSARDFMLALNSVGFAEQDFPRTYVYAKEQIFIGDDNKHATISPYNGLRITCTIDFPHPMIGRQTVDYDINEKLFADEIAAARTFGFFKDVEALRAKGLARGGGLHNAIVLDEKGILNPEGLRWPNEFVRHKVLDALGDLVTLGKPLMGHLVLFKAGHDLMQKLVAKIKANYDAYRHVELGTRVTR